MSTCKTFYSIFFIIILWNELQGGPEVDWFDSVKTRLCDSRDVHTAVIVHHNNAGDSDIIKDKIFGKIIRSMSSLLVEMDDDGILLIESDFGVVSKLSTSLLFIFYAEYSGNNTKINRVIDSLNELADFTMNYLLIILRTSSNFNGEVNGILRHAWEKSILNIVIIEIRLATTLNSSVKLFADNPMILYCNYEKYKKADRKIDNSNSSHVMVHSFNPFINESYHKEFSTEIELFPNFARNMHKHPLNVGITPQSRFSSVKWDKNNNLKEMKGPNIELIQTIVGRLNFTPIFIRDPNIAALRKKSVENIIKIMKMTKLDIYASLLVIPSDDIMERSLRLRPILKRKVRVLMPKKYEIHKHHSKNAIESSGLTLVIIMIIWFAVILLKFDNEIWNLCSIFCLIFSSTVPHQPSRTYERILFLFVAMLGFMYSNDIYASLTNLGIDDLVEKKYETFEDIADSCLTPIVHINAETMRELKNLFVHELHWKERIEMAPTSWCVELAKASRNVCCVLYELSSELQQQGIRDDQQLRFAEPILLSNDVTFRFRQGLPGKKEMNQVIERCDETGLLGKWYWNPLEHSITADDKAQLRDKILTSNLLERLIIIVVFGHSLATLVFIGELLTHRYIKNSFKEKSLLSQ